MLRHEISPAIVMNLWYLGVSMMVLAPLAYAKRRLGKRMGSCALQGDAALRGTGGGYQLARADGPGFERNGGMVGCRVVSVIVTEVAAAAALHTMWQPTAPWVRLA